VLAAQGTLVRQNPVQPLAQFHAGEAAAVALAWEQQWWLLLNEQRALTFARQHALKVVTVLELIVYLYEAHLLSYRSARVKLDGIAANTGQRVMQAAHHALGALAQERGEG
jgi:predicted nucleic acid-binding protein